LEGRSAAVSKDDGPAAHPSRLVEPVIGPRFARTRWLAPAATTAKPLRRDDGENLTNT